MKYNHEGGDVRLDGVTVGGRHRLTITDTGIGIAEADLGRLFQPFDRLAADTTEVEGSGLGLALSRQLMSAMSGEIGVTSRLGLGSSFWIELPVTQDTAATRRRARPRRRWSPANGLPWARRGDGPVRRGQPVQRRASSSGCSIGGRTSPCSSPGSAGPASSWPRRGART